MTILTRRSLLATAAATLAAQALPAFAAPASFKHGAFEVTVVSDGHWMMATNTLAYDAPPAARAEMLAAAGQTGEQFYYPANLTLIRSADDLILIDTGSGDRFMSTTGKVWDNLKNAGIDKNKITKVVFTHGHPDHLWGTVDELDDLALPHATHYVAAAEWDFWNGDSAMRNVASERAGLVTGARRNYAAIKNRVKMFKAGDEIVSGLRTVATPGHTQGHVAIELAGGDGLIVGGDALLHPLISFQKPAWSMTADHVPDQAAQTRAKLLDRLATDRSKLIGFHLPYPGVGVVERKDGAYRFVPV